MINQQSLAFGQIKSAIRELAAYGAKRKREIGPENVFDFSLGNPSVPAPEQVRRSIERHVAGDPVALHSYTPGAGDPQVRETIAASLCRRFGERAATAENLYMTCGAAASISIALNAVCEAGDEVIVIAPYFPEYAVWIANAGAVCVEVMADPVTFQVDAAALAQAITPRTRAVIINSPNNPVGVVYSRETLVALASALDEGQAVTGERIALISDEPYREVTYGAEVPWVPDVYDRTIVCYSYSKSLSMPGERIGWVLVAPRAADADDLVAAVAGAGRKLGFVCAPSLLQRVVADCVDCPSDVAAYAANRELLCRGLADAGFDFVEPQGAFYLWMRSPEPDAAAFVERAKGFEILPVPSDSFGCTGWVRVGYCVAHDTIERSLPAWVALARSYL